MPQGAAGPARPSIAELKSQYTLQAALMRRSELLFYHALKDAIGHRYMICPKVRLLDVSDTDRRADVVPFNRVVSKHLDFLLCEPTTSKPVAAIELDGSSHSRRDRAARDDFVDDLLSAIGLPLIRFSVAYRYDLDTIRRQVEAARNMRRSTTTVVADGFAAPRLF